MKRVMQSNIHVHFSCFSLHQYLPLYLLHAPLYSLASGKLKLEFDAGQVIYSGGFYEFVFYEKAFCCWKQG